MLIPEVDVLKLMGKLGGLSNISETAVTVAMYNVWGNRSGASISTAVVGTETLMEAFCACGLSTGLRASL